MKGAEPWSPCSLITVLIMLPGNNMHFIFFPSLCLYHSRPRLPLSSLLSSPTPPSSSSPLCPVLFVTSSTWSLLFLHPFPLFPCARPLVLSLLDFQSCLICVARRVPMKERPMLPTHESFTTRQDLQGTRPKATNWYCRDHSQLTAHRKKLL